MCSEGAWDTEQVRMQTKSECRPARGQTKALWLGGGGSVEGRGDGLHGRGVGGTGALCSYRVSGPLIILYG